jgi:putative serine protease PepD
VSTTWSDQPPATPPTTDTDPCVAWGAEAHAGHHDHHHAARHDDPIAAAPPVPPAWTLPHWEANGLPTPPPEHRPVVTHRSRGAKVLAGTLAVAGLLGAGFVTRGLVDSGPSTSIVATTAPAVAVADPTPRVDGDADEPVAAVAEALGPSVVKIQTKEGLGSGVVYDASGLILTNAHVVGSERSVQVVFSDGTTVEGQVLGADEANDIAVVQVAATGDLSVARLATEQARVGQLAVAVGSPFGLEQTVTSGVVSAVNRPVEGATKDVVGMLQTDAPINPGNSGGALANREAEVIGINSMIFSESGENNGIGFAIPIDRAKEIADALVQGGTVSRGYLGVSSTTPSDGAAGAELAQVEAGSPAAQAGLQVGDVIVAIDGTPIKAQGDLAVTVGTHEPGDTVSVEIVRNGSTSTVDVTLGSK